MNHQMEQGIIAYLLLSETTISAQRVIEYRFQSDDDR